MNKYFREQTHHMCTNICGKERETPDEADQLESSISEFTVIYVIIDGFNPMQIPRKSTHVRAYLGGSDVVATCIS
jgi:hypothetical protein